MECGTLVLRRTPQVFGCVFTHPTQVPIILLAGKQPLQDVHLASLIAVNPEIVVVPPKHLTVLRNKKPKDVLVQGIYFKHNYI